LRSIGSRIAKVVALAGTAIYLTALPAVAQYPPTQAPTGVAPPGPGDEEVAFTGADITLWMVLLGVLIVGGVLALVIGWRRAKSAA
jgi:hypothetical protein